jgi:C4-dicarboxylate-specific signal transduction histidine kinase
MADADRLPELEGRNALLQQQLVQAQKLTALGELLGTTTHEFNNVLTTILNYAKLGLRHKDEATRDKALQKILAAGERVICPKCLRSVPAETSYNRCYSIC